jgi:hypothetical protein
MWEHFERYVTSTIPQPSTSSAPSIPFIVNVDSNYIDPNDVMPFSSSSFFSDYILFFNTQNRLQ